MYTVYNRSWLNQWIPHVAAVTSVDLTVSTGQMPVNLTMLIRCELKLVTLCSFLVTKTSTLESKCYMESIYLLRGAVLFQLERYP